MSVEPPIVQPHGRVLATRNAARKLIESRPDVSPTGAVYVRCDSVEAVAAPFFSELLKAWPYVQLVGAEEDVQATFVWVKERGGNRG